VLATSGKVDFEGLSSPAQFRGRGAGVVAVFLKGGADDFIIHGTEDACAEAIAEKVLYATILAGMKGQNGHATAGF
jgi:hypothetical protein